MADTTNDLTTEEDEFYRKCVFARKMAKDLQYVADSLLRDADNYKCKRESDYIRKAGNDALDIRKMFVAKYSEYLN